MDFLGAPHLDVPMTEMTEVLPGEHGGRKSTSVNLGPPLDDQPRRSVTGYDASYESKFFIT